MFSFVKLHLKFDKVVSLQGLTKSKHGRHASRSAIPEQEKVVLQGLKASKACYETVINLQPLEVGHGTEVRRRGVDIFHWIGVNDTVWASSTNDAWR